MKVYAIDPGNTRSALCVIDADTLRPLDAVILENELLMQRIGETKLREEDRVAIEMLQSYGNLIGRDVLETAVWIGRFYEAFRRKMPVTGEHPALVFRIEEKIHICGDPKAGDANIRRALIDRFCDHDFRTGRGTVKNPDWFSGFAKDMWAAYAVGLTYIETELCRKESLT